MAFVDITNPNERNKLIVASLLGLLALFALYFAFGRSMFGSSTTNVSVKISPTPKPSVSPAKDTFKLPTREQQTFDNVTTPIVYLPGNNPSADPGRNIFAFYEPPAPTPYSPTPIPPARTPPTPTPTPTPDLLIAAAEPQTVYAGSNSFRLTINGDRFTPDSHIYWSQTELPTTYVSPQQIYADIPTNLIAQEGPRQIIVQTPDGKKYSNQVILTVEAPPTPTIEYLGLIARKRGNNDTAYFVEKGSPSTVTKRLNDVIGGRFRLINIAATQVVFEDTILKFKHIVPLKIKEGATSTGPVPPAGRPTRQDSGFTPFNPGTMPQGEIPGIPSNIPRFVPGQQPGQPGQQLQPGQTPPQPGSRPQQPPKKDVDDNDDGDGR